MSRYLLPYGFAALAVSLLSGCGAPHGQPRSGAETLAPTEVLDFSVLYGENCAACHGQEGRGGDEPAGAREP